jgi:hypothetical protein
MLIIKKVVVLFFGLVCLSSITFGQHVPSRNSHRNVTSRLIRASTGNATILDAFRNAQLVLANPSGVMAFRVTMANKNETVVFLIAEEDFPDHDTGVRLALAANREEVAAGRVAKMSVGDLGDGTIDYVVFYHKDR